MLKKVLSDKQYLIMEPGIIMYFLQDYFYSNQKISIQDIKIFNKIFVKTDYIIHSHSKLKLQLKRLKLRTRGLPQRMRGLNKKEIYRVIKKSNLEIRKYISNSNNLNSKIIKINTSNNFKKFENFLK